MAVPVYMLLKRRINDMRNDVLTLTNPMEEKELEQILGGGNGVLKTISHECNMNTWQFLFTCC
jgi:hypothetical protein